MYLYVCVRMYYVFMYVRVYVCVYVHMYVCVCNYACIHT